MVSQSSIFPFSKLSLPKAKPALFTKISMCFHSSGKFSIALKTSALFCTSKFRDNTFTSCSLFNALLIACNFSFLLPVIIIFHFAAANFSAIAFPKPAVAPVMSIVFGMIKV